ncbi:MAG TPA: hypothetical protein VKV77_02265 [Methylovirgula sp.]|nr:hypothetical protein [Methylovirgula sp.]
MKATQLSATLALVGSIALAAPALADGASQHYWGGSSNGILGTGAPPSEARTAARADVPAAFAEGSAAGTGHYWAGSSTGIPGTGGTRPEVRASARTGYDVPAEFTEGSAAGTGHFWGGSSNGLAVAGSNGPGNLRR